MNSPQRRQERRDFRFPLHLPVLVRMPPCKEMHARSENISMGGILLSSAFLIPEGSAVEVSIGVEHMPDPGILLSAHGKVLRVHPKDTGEFELAIRLDSSFSLPRPKADPVSRPPDLPTLASRTQASRTQASRPQASRLQASRSWEKKPPASVAHRNSLLSSRGLLLDLAWQTET
jgi:PilZ domain